MEEEPAPKRRRRSLRLAPPGFLAQYGRLFRGGACVNELQAAALRLAFMMSAQPRVGVASHPTSAGLIGDVIGWQARWFAQVHSLCATPRACARRWQTPHRARRM